MSKSKFQGSVAVTGIGKLVYGDFEPGCIDADTVIAANGIISAIGHAPGVGEDALEAMQLDDTFGVSMVMVDGQVVSVKGRDGRPTKRCILIDDVPTYIDSINEYLFGRYFPGYLR
jgi:hypothetical protein